MDLKARSAMTHLSSKCLDMRPTPHCHRCLIDTVNPSCHCHPSLRRDLTHDFPQFHCGAGDLLFSPYPINMRRSQYHIGNTGRIHVRWNSFRGQCSSEKDFHHD